MTNSKLLREKIKKSGYKITFIAEQCQLSYQGLMNKINGKTEFTAPEILKLRMLLGLSVDDAEHIFFAA